MDEAEAACLCGGPPQPDGTAQPRDVSARSGDENRHRAIFDSAVDFAIIATSVDGLVTDWHAGAIRLLGWSAEEMRGQPPDRFFTPEDRQADRPREETRQALATGRASDERWHLRRDGLRFWASGEMMPLRCQDGALLGVSQDPARPHPRARGRDCAAPGRGVPAPDPGQLGQRPVRHGP